MNVVNRMTNTRAVPWVGGTESIDPRRWWHLARVMKESQRGDMTWPTHHRNKERSTLVVHKIKATAPSLSQKISRGSKMPGTTPRSPMKFFDQTTYLAPSHVAMYSDSHVDSDTMSCFELFHVIAPPLSKNTQPDYDRESSLSVWELAST
ncbi:hypothetical protein LXL04_024316 [Taraxacum kok-saghyz]